MHVEGIVDVRWRIALRLSYLGWVCSLQHFDFYGLVLRVFLDELDYSVLVLFILVNDFLYSILESFNVNLDFVFPILFYNIEKESSYLKDCQETRLLYNLDASIKFYLFYLFLTLVLFLNVIDDVVLDLLILLFRPNSGMNNFQIYYIQYICPYITFLVRVPRPLLLYLEQK